MAFADDLQQFGPDVSTAVSLDEARAYCARLTATHYENFSVVTWLTPRALRPAFQSVYSFCRWSDDLGDEVGDRQRSRELLAWWRGELRRMYEGKARHPVMVALAETVREYEIPIAPFEALISAFEQDQEVLAYETYPQLADYCTRSANPVGHLVLYLGRSYNEENARLSDCTCTALQLANFWQDVARDMDIGRIYLPAEDRERFGVTVEDLQNRRFSQRYADLLRFEVERTRDLFAEGWPLVGTDAEGPGRGCRSLHPRWAGDSGPDRGSRVRHADASARGQQAGEGRFALASLARSVGLVDASKQAAGSRPESYGAGNLSNRHSRVRWGEVVVSEANLRASDEFCRRLSRREARNFYYSFLVLPPERRRSMCALYAFMRHTDDLADEPGEVADKRAALETWRADLDRALEGQPDAWPGLPALAHAVHRHGIPPKYLHEVIDGVAMDLEPRPFPTFEDLYAYCYRVASAVGLCCLHIWGYRSEGGRAESLAESCGIALQLTNILRDVREDAPAWPGLSSARGPGPFWRPSGGSRGVSA